MVIKTSLNVLLSCPETATVAHNVQNGCHICKGDASNRIQKESK